MCPDGTLAGLEAVFGFHRHELAGIDKLLEQFGDLLLQLRSIGFQVTDEQVHQRFGVGAHAIVGAR